MSPFSHFLALLFVSLAFLAVTHASPTSAQSSVSGPTQVSAMKSRDAPNPTNPFLALNVQDVHPVPASTEQISSPPASQLSTAAKLELRNTSRPTLVVQCSSHNYRVAVCNTHVHIVAGFVLEKISRSSCTPNKSFAFFGSFIVVSAGCRAKFIIFS